MKDESPVTLITGTRKGVGKYLAEYYVKQGHIVIGCSRGTPDWSLEGYTHFNADVNNEEQVRPIFRHISDTHRRLDNLINNAGIAAMNHSLLTPLATVRRLVDTNLVGSFLFCQEAARLMQRRSYGRIVNFSTVAVPLSLEGECIYAATKSAVVKMTQVLAREYADFGITLNTIGPNGIETDLIKNVGEERIKRIQSRLAIHKNGKMEDVTNVIDFFISKASGMVTGQIIYLGGI